jgi:hypothetical protein
LGVGRNECTISFDIAALEEWFDMALVLTVHYVISEDEQGQQYILCRTCDRRSYHPRDIIERYCGHCHVFHDDLKGMQ